MGIFIFVHRVVKPARLFVVMVVPTYTIHNVYRKTANPSQR